MLSNATNKYGVTSLASVVSKVLENISDQLRSCSECEGLLMNCQCGIRQRPSADDLVAFVSHSWPGVPDNHLETNSGSLDIPKAFD